MKWTYDTYMLAKSGGGATVRAGGDRWFFVAADYSFGQQSQRDATRFVLEAGGEILGAANYPFPQTTDFSAYLAQAQASGANVVAFADAGDDFINCLKQANEFGLTDAGVARRTRRHHHWCSRHLNQYRSNQGVAPVRCCKPEPTRSTARSDRCSGAGIQGWPTTMQTRRLTPPRREHPTRPDALPFIGRQYRPQVPPLRSSSASSA